MKIISYDIFLTKWWSDISNNIYLVWSMSMWWCLYDDQPLSMRLCLQWDIVRSPIGADTVYSVHFYGSTCFLYVCDNFPEWYNIISDWLLTNFSALWAVSYWILIGRLLYSSDVIDGLDVYYISLSDWYTFLIPIVWVILNSLFDLTQITYSCSYLFYYLWVNKYDY